MLDNPVTQHMKAWAGSVFEHSFQWLASGVAVDLAGYEARLLLRRASSWKVLKEVSTTDGGIGIAEAEGVITITLTASETLAIGSHRYDHHLAYDLLLVPPAGEEEAFIFATGKFDVLATTPQPAP